MALSSFLMSAGIVYGGWYVYNNVDKYAEMARQQVIEEIQSAIPQILDSSIPEVPNVSELPEVNQLPSTEDLKFIP